MAERVTYLRRFGRLDRLKELMTSRMLSLGRFDFRRSRPIASIIGDHISDRIRAHGMYEREILEILRERILVGEDCRHKVAIDVGANIGNHSMFLSDLFERVIAFEPNPLARSLLEINLAMNGIGNVEVKPLGLSDRPGQTELAFYRGNLGAARPAYATNQQAAPDGRAHVELAIGDEVIPASAPVGFIKVDVEGGEEAALKGLENTIRTHRPVLMIEQLGDVVDPERGASPSFERLRDLGYAGYEIRVRRLFRGRSGSLLSLLLGRTAYRLIRVDRLEKRDYPALILVPDAPSQAVLS